jgi:hypothetical protein
MRDLSKALTSLYPGAQWVLNGDEYSGLDWLPTNTVPKPTQKELEDEADRLHQVWLNNQYQRDRARAYPSFAEQFDTLYHGGYDAWKASIDEVKNKYPKGK